MVTRKYKAGDKVFVRKDLSSETRYSMIDPKTGVKLADDIATEEMIELSGKVVTISKVTEWGKYWIKEMGCNWTDEMFSGKACSFCCEGLI